MTIGSTTVQTNGSTGNGATTVFSFSFNLDPDGYGATSADEQVQVIRVTIATGAEETLVLSTDYTVSINADQSANPGGSITMLSAPSSAYKIYIRLNPDYTQQTDYQNQGGFLMETVEDQADQHTRDIIAIKDMARRSPHIGVQGGTAFNGEMTGTPVAGQVPVIKSDLSGWVLGTPVDSAISAAMLPVVQAGTTDAGLALLNGVLEVADIAALTALTGGVVDAVFVRDATRGGMFYWDSASSATGDSGTIFAPDAGGTGRWKRRYDGAVFARWFGSTMQAGLAAALTASFDDIIVDSSFTQTAQFVPSANCWIRGAGKHRPVITKGFNGNMFDVSADGCALEWLELQGAGATFTGCGAITTGGTEPRIDDCVIADMESYPIHFNGNNAGQRAQILDSYISARNLTGVASIKITNTAGGEANGNRLFQGLGLQGGYMDIGDSAATNISGCNLRNVVFASGSKRSQIVGNRIATSGDTLAIDGIDHTVVGNTIAGAVTLSAGSQRCTVGPNTMVDGGTITDNSTISGNDMNVVYGEEASPTPVWGASGQDIGNGTFACRYVRQGRLVTVTFNLVAGSSTNFGAGEWTFALPAPYNRLAKARAAGSAQGRDVSASKYYTGVPVIELGGNTIKIAPNDAANNWNASAPITWADTDSLVATITYEVG